MFYILFRGKFKLSSILFIEIQYSLYRRRYSRAVSSAFAVELCHMRRALSVCGGDMTSRAASKPQRTTSLSYNPYISVQTGKEKHDDAAFIRRHVSDTEMWFKAQWWYNSLQFFRMHLRINKTFKNETKIFNKIKCKIK